MNVETIASQATPPGRGGVGMIRISGPHVHQVMKAVLGCELKPRHATFLSFYDANQQVIDQGIAIYFSAPHSFTGENVLELQGHGGPVILDMLLSRILQLNVRLARPGEFSERAFLNEKLDLAQAEAIADLINASSEQAARLAMRSLEGDFSKAINAINQRIIELRMYVEAAIDFSDEEIDFLNQANIAEQIEHILQQLMTLQHQATQGSLLREGIRIAIIGEPNVGKSSLLNALSGKKLAIVTDIPGTTRDVIRSEIAIQGIPLHIIDTAGLRESTDVIEQEGIRLTHQEIEQADLILYVVDASQTTKNDDHTFSEIVHTKNCLRVINKIDLLDTTLNVAANPYEVFVSAKSGIGLEKLREQILNLIGFQAGEGLFLARRRHMDAIHLAIEHITSSKSFFVNKHIACELIAEELRLAHQALSEITGKFSSDDLLGHIFSQFCIGK